MRFGAIVALDRIDPEIFLLSPADRIPPQFAREVGEYFGKY